MKYLPLFIKVLVSLAVTILLPQSHITTILATLNNKSFEAFQHNALFMLIMTIFVDTINSIPLGTTAFAWLLTIGPFLAFGALIRRLYHPSVLLLQKVGQTLSLLISVLVHQTIIGLLVGLPYIPSLTEYFIVTITSIILLWLTRTPSI